MTHTILYDDTDWPIVRIVMPPRELSTDEFSAHVERIERYYERRQSFAMVLDARRAPPPTPEQRRMLAASVDACRSQYPGVECVAACAISNSVARGVLRVLSWLTAQPVEFRPFPTPEAAEAWALTWVRLHP